MEGLSRALDHADDDTDSNGSRKKEKQSYRQQKVSAQVVGRVVSHVERQDNTQAAASGKHESRQSFLQILDQGSTRRAKESKEQGKATPNPEQNIQAVERKALGSAQAEAAAADRLAKSEDLDDVIGDVPEGQDQVVVKKAIENAKRAESRDVGSSEDGEVSIVRAADSVERTDEYSQQGTHGQSGVEDTAYGGSDGEVHALGDDMAPESNDTESSIEYNDTQTESNDERTVSPGATTGGVGSSAGSAAGSIGSSPRGRTQSSAGIAPSVAGSSGGAAGGPPVPPSGLRAGFGGYNPGDGSSNLRHDAAAAPSNYNSVTNLAPQTPNMLASPTIINQEEADLAYRRGRNRGLIAGLVIGGAVEHVRHRRRERRMERDFKQERKQHEKDVENMRWDHIREKESEKILREATQKPVSNKSVEPTSPGIGRAESGAVRPYTTEQTAGGDYEMRKARLAEASSEQAAQERTEQHRVARQAEQAAAEIQQELAELAEGNHIERSVWHNIEVDKTGKAVRDGSFEYGSEYYRERAHETNPLAKQQIDITAGEVALVAAALSEASQTQSDAAYEVANRVNGEPDVRKEDSDARVKRVAGGQSGPGGVSGSGSFVSADDGQSGRDDSPDPQRSSGAKSVMKAITAPPTTLGGTVAWLIALIVIVIVFLTALL